MLNVQRRNEGAVPMIETNHYDLALKEFDDLYNAMLEMLVAEYEEKAE